ncbi:hypothetical protein [Nocardia sp. CC227C]|uniref:hypothetical protein n=1 Tax=Nocardia sp. CC227C TaxID=3044562 RepID=UPI00278BC36A|nr:hypothetical protein [Nocardia sp. CC227C]
MSVADATMKGMGMEATKAVAAELNGYLVQQKRHLRWLRNRSMITDELTKLVVAWARDHQGWRAKTEQEILFKKGVHHPGEWWGYVDVGIERPKPLPPLMIEIDSANKRWSLDKLVGATDQGWDAIWLRWGAPQNPQLLIPEPVQLVYLDVKPWKKPRTPR